MFEILLLLDQQKSNPEVVLSNHFVTVLLNGFRERGNNPQ